MSKRAVCVGINDYPGVENDLNGCVNDARAWERSAPLADNAAGTVGGLPPIPPTYSAADFVPSGEAPIGVSGINGRPAVTKPRRCNSSLRRRKAANPSG